MPKDLPIGSSEGGLINQPSGDLMAGPTIAVLEEMASVLEFMMLALVGAHGLNATEMKQAMPHLLRMRQLLGRTSRDRPDDRPSKWPEGEDIDPDATRVDRTFT